jgi:hypothetical protein
MDGSKSKFNVESVPPHAPPHTETEKVEARAIASHETFVLFITKSSQ